MRSFDKGTRTKHRGNRTATERTKAAIDPSGATAVIDPTGATAVIDPTGATAVDAAGAPVLKGAIAKRKAAA